MWNPSDFTAVYSGLTGTTVSLTINPVAASGVYPMQYTLHTAGIWSLEITTPATGLQVYVFFPLV